MADANPDAFVASTIRATATNTEPTYRDYHDMKPPQSADSHASGTVPSDEAMHKAYTADFPSHLPCPPFIDVQGIPNFRDLGGYPCPPPPGTASSGQTYMVRRNLLFRCAHPTQLTTTGASTLTSKLGITDIYDLRSAPEIARLAASGSFQPPPPSSSSPGSVETPAASSVNPLATPFGYVEIPGVQRHFTPVYEADDYGPVALARKLKWYTAANNQGDEYSEGFVNAYRDIATHGAAAYAEILRRLLVDEKGGLIFHCTAGKDRTGVLGAVILKLCDVDEDTICWEYAITEPGLGKTRDLFIQRISKGGLGGAGSEKGGEQDTSGMSWAEASRICGSRAANMRAWLIKVLDGELGGVQRYLVDVIGLSADEVNELRRKLVVEVKKGDDVVKPVAIQGWTLEDGMLSDKARENGRLGLDESAGRPQEEKVMTG